MCLMAVFAASSLVLATGLAYQFSGFLQLPYSSGTYQTTVRAAAKISAGGRGRGGVGSPYKVLRQLYTKSYQQATSVKISILYYIME